MTRTLKGKGCGQISYAVNNQEEVGYGLWRGVLSVAANCRDSKIAIHAVSNKHPNYTAAETEKIAKGTVDKPQLCTTFHEAHPGICDTCSHFGKMGGPIDLGIKIKKSTIS